MNIAILADIHANLPALESIVESISQCDLIICCGDIVGYYPHPNEVCSLLRNLDVVCIRGNHDAMVCGRLPTTGDTTAYRTEWTRMELELTHLRWLSALPITIRFDIDALDLLVRHASLEDEVTYLYPDSNAVANLHLRENQWLICGHTHIPLVRTAGKGVIVNPGSVGQPRDYIPGASFAIFNTERKDVQFHRSYYDITKYQSHLVKLGWPTSTISILSRSRESG
jgi:putative phosphoesterase